jgi:hypothetical protein
MKTIEVLFQKSNRMEIKTTYPIQFAKQTILTNDEVVDINTPSGFVIVSITEILPFVEINSCDDNKKITPFN